MRGQHILPGSKFINIQAGYIDQPLVQVNQDGSRSALVDSVRSLDFRPGVLLSDRILLSGVLSLNSVSFDGQSKIGLGDSFVQLNYRITGVDQPIQMALIPEVTIPIGDNEKYLSNGDAGGSLKIAAATQLGRFRLNTNLGYRYQANERWRSLDYSNQAIAGLGAEAQFSKRFSMTLEAIGNIAVPYEEKNSVGELYLGGLWSFAPTTTLALGVSTSGFDSDGSQSTRGILSFKNFFDVRTPGKQEVKKPICEVEPFNVRYHSRPLTADEEVRFRDELPYDSSKSVPSKGRLVSIRTLRFGEVTAVTSTGIPYVEDAQIPFAIDINDLPAIGRIRNIHHANLKVSVNKISTDRYVGTELLCSVDFKICSGEAISRRKWMKVLNPNYFDEGDKTANANFSKLFLDKPVGTVGKETLYSGQLTLSLASLIEGNRGDSLSIEKVLDRAREAGTLYFVIGEDTYPLTDITLELSMAVEKCR